MTRKTISADLGACVYLGADGVRRIGTSGEEVDVHASDVARFDRVNDPGQPAPKKPAPVKKAAPKKRVPVKRARK